jgi:hypothetical protein
VSPVLPVLAVAQMTAVQGFAPVLVSRPRSRGLHLHQLDVPRGRGTDSASFTDSGALRAGRRTLCGQRARRWYRAGIDGRPLCRRCTRKALALTSVVDGDRAARLVSTDDLVRTVVTARTPADLSAARVLAFTPGVHPLMGTVDGPDGPVRLSRLLEQAADRISRRSPLSPRDHTWAARLRPVARFPRRVR